MERAWVTDNERVEQVVYELGRAVEASDAAAVLDRLTPDVQLVVGGRNRTSDDIRGVIERAVCARSSASCESAQLQARAGVQSRRGTAEFKVIAARRLPAGVLAAVPFRHEQLDLVAGVPRDEPRRLEGLPDFPRARTGALAGDVGRIRRERTAATAEPTDSVPMPLPRVKRRSVV